MSTASRPKRKDQCFVHVQMFGNGGKAKITFDFKVPADLEDARSSPEKGKEYVTEVLEMIQNETKYSADWHCYKCDQPAHDVIHSPEDWLAQQKPFIMDWAQAVCRLDGPCVKEIEESNNEVGLVTAGKTPQPPAASEEKVEESGEAKPAEGADSSAPPAEAAKDKAATTEAPLAGSCAVCHKTGKMSVCGRCKTIRYCGAECQGQDYERHKKVCKCVDFVEREDIAE